jgi:hypothetical protein
VGPYSEATIWTIARRIGTFDGSSCWVYGFAGRTVRIPPGAEPLEPSLTEPLDPDAPEPEPPPLEPLLPEPPFELTGEGVGGGGAAPIATLKSATQYTPTFPNPTDLKLGLSRFARCPGELTQPWNAAAALG